MKKIKLKADKQHTHDLEPMEAGQEIVVPNSYYNAFRDKFDVVDEAVGVQLKEVKEEDLDKPSEASFSEKNTPAPKRGRPAKDAKKKDDKKSKSGKKAAPKLQTAPAEILEEELETELEDGLNVEVDESEEEALDQVEGAEDDK